MKILIVEFSSHYKVLENVYKLISLNCEKSDVFFYINKDGDDSVPRALLFPGADDCRWIINPFHRCMFFIYFIFIARRFDLINISTGPEDHHYSNIFNVIFFYIASRLYGKKIVLTIKNTRPYLKNTPGVMAFFLSRAVSFIGALTFETETLKEVFHRETGRSLASLGVSYDRYTDLNIIDIGGNESDKDYICTFGLVGAVETERRNYSEIINALHKVPRSIRERFLFVTLGNTHGGYKNNILSELKSLTNVDITEGWISAEEFERRGQRCDVLISPLRRNMEYGTYKGSGTFGDAVYLRKKIIIPDYVDNLSEFSAISFYYSSESELINIFTNIETLLQKPIDQDYFEIFSTKNVYRSIYKMLLRNNYSVLK